MFNVPVAVFVFNRPDITRRLLGCLSLIKPDRLLVIADGPRVAKEGEVEAVRQVRALFEDLAWDCDVQFNYSDENMGCKGRVSSGLDWVFSKVDRAILLEDDCIASASFFEFCQRMLERYENDKRIMSVCGTRLAPEAVPADSYSFSKYSICWGWATWARAWKYYDGDMVCWDAVRRTNYLRWYLGGIRQGWYWNYMLGRVKRSEINSWAYRWMLSCWMNNGLSVVPGINLIENIGVGEDATHTTVDNKFFGVKAREASFTYEHPVDVMCDYEMDNWIEDHFYSKSVINRLRWLWKKIAD